jgi:ribulose-bisphosphate carboxylase large chain
MEQLNYFSADYQITADSKSDAETIARNICIEQSVEMPPEVVPAHVRSSIAALESIEFISEMRWRARIRFPKLLVGFEPTQFLNVLFGNSSLQPGIKLLDTDGAYLNELLPGPSFGIPGIRKLLNIHDRALSCTALKPIGLTPGELAERTYKFSSGGIDIIKDDHGLANQSSADFRSRVISCVRAVRKGEQKSGKRTLYFPNITTSPSQTVNRYEEAVSLGADGVLISPQLSGLETLCELSAIGSIPVMAHPALSGSFLIHDSQGIAAPLYLGKLWRSFGADCVIYPNARGRFTFGLDLCKKINRQCRAKLGGFHPTFPTPGGGIDRDSVSVWLNEYGKDTILLIGGSLYQHPDGLERAAQEFQHILEHHGK